jgi:hypothetical protein
MAAPEEPRPKASFLSGHTYEVNKSPVEPAVLEKRGNSKSRQAVEERPSQRVDDGHGRIEGKPDKELQAFGPAFQYATPNRAHWM